MLSKLTSEVPRDSIVAAPRQSIFNCRAEGLYSSTTFFLVIVVDIVSLGSGFLNVIWRTLYI